MRWTPLEDKVLSHVPGTSLLVEMDKKPDFGDTSRLKTKQGKKGEEIVLVPQPCEDPNDPLNWTRAKRLTLMVQLCYATGLVGAIGPLISPGLVTVAQEFGITMMAATQISGAAVMAIAIGTFFSAAGGTVFGHRLMYLIAAFFLFISAIWCAASPSYPVLMAGRIIQGAAMAPLETLVPATLADIFFVHERGTAMAVWSTALILGISITPMVNGIIIEDKGWRFCFWIISAVFGVMLILTFLFQPETRFIRPAKYNIDLGSSDDLSGSPSKETPSTPNSETEKAEIDQLEVAHATDSAPIPKKKTFVQELKPYEGRKSPEPYWRVFFRPFNLVQSPVLVWAALLYGTNAALYVVLATLNAMIFAMPPYEFGPAAVGYIGSGPLIFFWIGLGQGPVMDWVAKRLARMNGGVFEPEFRLVWVAPMLLLQVAGLVLFGVSVQQGMHWIAPAAGYTIFAVGQGFGSLAASVYVLDAHRERSADCFVMITLYKNAFTFILFFFASDWILARGLTSVCGTLAGVISFVSLLTIPMYIYGKRARSWVHRRGLDHK